VTTVYLNNRMMAKKERCAHDAFVIFAEPLRLTNPEQRWCAMSIGANQIAETASVHGV
jgi:hypothetical protein